MQVTISLIGETTRSLANGVSKARVEAAEGVTIAALLAQLGLPDNEFLLQAVNGTTAAADTILHDGDLLECVAPMSGG